jgi:hypothetical protein
MQLPGTQIGFYLPKVIVELMPPLEFQQRTQPCWETDVMKMEPLDRALGQALLNARAVPCLGKGPDVMDPGDLLK